MEYVHWPSKNIQYMREKYAFMIHLLKRKFEFYL